MARGTGATSILYGQTPPRDAGLDASPAALGFAHLPSNRITSKDVNYKDLDFNGDIFSNQTIFFRDLTMLHTDALWTHHSILAKDSTGKSHQGIVMRGRGREGDTKKIKLAFEPIPLDHIRTEEDQGVICEGEYCTWYEALQRVSITMGWQPQVF